MKSILVFTAISLALSSAQASGWRPTSTAHFLEMLGAETTIVQRSLKSNPEFRSTLSRDKYAIGLLERGGASKVNFSSVSAFDNDGKLGLIEAKMEMPSSNGQLREYDSAQLVAVDSTGKPVVTARRQEVIADPNNTEGLSHERDFEFAAESVYGQTLRVSHSEIVSLDRGTLYPYLEFKMKKPADSLKPVMVSIEKRIPKTNKKPARVLHFQTAASNLVGLDARLLRIKPSADMNGISVVSVEKSLADDGTTLLKFYENEAKISEVDGGKIHIEFVNPTRRLLSPLEAQEYIVQTRQLTGIEVNEVQFSENLSGSTATGD